MPVMIEFYPDDTPLLLTPAQARVLGCLIEKEVTTPDTYPLSFNGLTSACNQKSNRNPIVDFDETIIAEAVEALREHQLLFRVDGAGARVQKYKHRIEERLGLAPPAKALLTVLLLRGPQTLGELRTRTERMHSFVNTDAVALTLTEGSEEAVLPLWQKLPQAAGQKEARYMHLLSGVPDPASNSEATQLPEAPAFAALQERNARIEHLEERLERVESELEQMRVTFAAFREQFD